MVRRLLPQTRIIKGLLEGGTLGSLQSIEIFEGGPFDWPIASSQWFAPGAGGGILDDLGIHVLDLLRWWLGEPDELEYRDDALGGVPANAEIRLRFGSTLVKVRLSCDWHLPNSYRFVSAQGWLYWPIHQQDEIEGELQGEAFTLIPEGSSSYPLAIARQIRALAEGKPVTGAQDVLGTMSLLQRCRDAHETMAMQWL
jgi:predicted dehydrogenase